ncbi:hypothetical protein I79_018889 [Cricetulus griseus]|uniref:Uncharacterized protein n=1 Tax=Cricetulus griseus TaxID=10029 RepID=G3I5X8_CRIGR|nr:hypothetical protein I79_018889 [Cricetulus griseus]
MDPHRAKNHKSVQLAYLWKDTMTTATPQGPCPLKHKLPGHYDDPCELYREHIIHAQGEVTVTDIWGPSENRRLWDNHAI